MVFVIVKGNKIKLKTYPSRPIQTKAKLGLLTISTSTTEPTEKLQDRCKGNPFI